MAAEKSADPKGMERVEKDEVAGETVATEEDKKLDTADAYPAKELENDESEENEVANDEDTNNAESDGNSPSPQDKDVGSSFYFAGHN